MANYPVSITKLDTLSVIIELSDSNPANTVKDTKMGGGYVRQKGLLVINCSVDDFVQFNAATLFSFIQGGITFGYINSSNIFFVQGILP